MVAGLPQHESIVIAPVLHYQLEYADAVRRLIATWQPEAIVVELPPTLEAQARKAVARLPQLSVVLYQDTAGEPVYFPVEPCDALIEAVRSGDERSIPVIFGDVDIDTVPLYDEPFPDSYSIFRLGLAAIWEAYHEANAEPPKSADDERRETSLAWHAQQAAEVRRRVLVVCGMAHASGVLARLSEPLAQPLAKQHRDAVQIFNVHPESARGIMASLPFASAVYEHRRRGLPDIPDQVEARFIEHPSGLRMVSTGLDTEAVQAAHRDRLRRQFARLPESYLEPLDQLAAIEGLRQASADAYESHTGESLKPSERRTWRIFCRNWAIVEGRLLPDLYQLVVGARGVADDNLAHEVWDLGSEWPWQQEQAEYPTARMSPDEIWLGSHRITFRPRVKREKMRLHPIRLKERKHERRPGEWRQEFYQGRGICSYPPEDLIVEAFGDHLKQKAKHVLAEDDARVEAFQSSLLDGIDVRETLRNWHEGTLYVKELRRVRGEVGSVVVIFDEDDADHRYPWRMTWHGEHTQESDMAFYATEADRQIVGPGISRCEYGGFLMSYPPGRLYEIWADPDYDWVHSKSERLLLAGLDYSEHRHVVYVAAKPPRSIFKSWAGRIGRQIVYLPIGSLSPVTLKKLRVFHVLSGHDKREIAGEYLW